jgi:hypothetical protein
MGFRDLLRRFAGLFFVTVVSCHDPLGQYRVDVFTDGYIPPRGGSAVPVAFVVNQIVTFVARESDQNYFSDCDCEAITTSKEYPTYFAWESDNPEVAKVVSPGKVQMVAVGVAKLKVSTMREFREMLVRVVPAISEVRVGVKNAELALNSIGWVSVVAYDDHGGRVPGIGVTEGSVWLTPEDLDANFTNPVASYSGAAGDSVAVYGLRTGTIRFIASLPVFGAHKLRDTVTIVVK